MFKLKVSKTEHKNIKKRLKLIESPKYDYVITDNKDDIEEDKINIVFCHADISKVSALLDWIVKGEELYITGYNEFGQKSVECRNIQYFVVEAEELYAVLHNSTLTIKLKLYEVEELLQEKEFVRVSKFCLVNIGKIDYIKTALNSKLDLLMKNGDHCEVNRSYLKAFKKALHI